VVGFRKLGGIRAEIAIWLVLLTVFIPTSVSASSFGTWGLVSTSNPLGGSVCLWAQAYDKVPGTGGAHLDFNMYGYREPNSSCNHTAPWAGTYHYPEEGVRAELWKSDYSAFCSDTNSYIIPAGSPGSGWGIGRSYNPVGLCSGATSFTIVGYAASAGTNYSQYSLVTFTA
jgi:hypothetical protein